MTDTPTAHDPVDTIGKDLAAAWEIARSTEPARGKVEHSTVLALRAALERLETSRNALPADALDGEDAEALEGKVATVYARSAVVAIAGGDEANGDRWLTAAEDASTDAEQLGELAAARRSHERYRALVHGRNLMANGRDSAARAIWKQLVKAGDKDAITVAARDELAAPRPIGPLDRMPALARYNGIGAGFYGRRDTWGDGSYATTHCISIVWVPVFPLSAWRVRDANNGYSVIAKEQLSPFARLWRLAFPIAIVVLIAGFAINSHLNDPDRLARKRWDRTLEDVASSTDKEAALHQLDNELGRDLSRVDNARAEQVGAEIVRLSSSYVTKPFTVEQLDPATRVVRRYQAMPVRAQGGAAHTAMLGALDGWTSQLGDKDETAEARLTLLGLESDLAYDDRKSEIAGKITAIRIAAATAKQQAWPVEAFAILAQESSGPAIAQADQIVERLVASPSLLLDTGTDLDHWMSVTTAGELRAKASAARDEATAARAEVDAEGVTPKHLADMAAKRPWDQRVALQLARNEAGAGKLDAAAARIAKLGEPGMTIRDVRFLAAQITAGQGKLDQADAMLTALLGNRLQRFAAASAAVRDATKAAQDRLISQLDSPSIPHDLRAKLEGATEAEQRTIVTQWLSEQLEADATVNSLRDRYIALGDVVPMSLAGGSIKLRRAQALTGAARSAMLEQAEKLFLAIRTEAEGQPEYRLGLGEIYARLGKTKESEAEFAAVLDKKDAHLSLQVASVYRDIGSIERAKQVAKDVYDHETGEAQQSAAQLLGLCYDTDDEAAESWYRKADQRNSFVQTSLLELEGARLLREGKTAECAAKFAAAAKAHLATAGSTRGAGYNNAAAAYQRGYACSGDPQLLKNAESALEVAYKNQPEDPIVNGNFAGVLERNGKRRVLAKHVDVRALKLDGGEIDSVLGKLLDSPERDAVLAELAADPSVHRGNELLAQFEVLAPNNSMTYALRLAEIGIKRDADAAAALLDRARHAKGLDVSEAAASRERWLSGAEDARFLAELGNARDRLEHALSQPLDPKTHAVGLYLLSETLGRIGRLKPDAALIVKGREAAAQAMQLWPAIDTNSMIVTALLDEAGLEADAKAWVEARRTRTCENIVERLSSQGSPIAAKIRASKSWAEIPRYAKADSSRRGIDDLRLARLLGDPELEARAKVAFDDKFAHVVTEFDLLLSPTNDVAKEDLAYFDKH